MAKIERKCPQCGTWNPGSNDHCSQCNQLLNPDEIRKSESEKRIAKVQERRLEESALERLIHRLNQSTNPFVKVVFVILKAVWVVYWAILTFFLWLIAATPG